MAQFPDYVIISLEGAGRSFDPGVTVSEMEKGLAKMRVSQRRVVVTVDASLRFLDQDSALNFETWYFDTIGRIGWFQWYDQCGEVTRTVRFKGGNIGKLEPIGPNYSPSKRSVVLEYLR